MYYDYEANPSPGRYKELIDYIYSIHHLRLLQTSALQTRYIKRPVTSAQKKVENALPLEKKVNDILTFRDIEEIFRKDIKENNFVYNISDFVFDITKAKINNSGKNYKNYNPLYINGNNKYIFYVAEAQTITIKVGSTLETKLSIKDEKGKIWLEKTIQGSKDEYEPIKINLPKGKYTLSFGAYYRLSRLVFPEHIPFFTSNVSYYNYQYPLQFLYVPKNVTEIIYKDAYGPGTNSRGNWMAPDGKTVIPELIKYDIYKVTVPLQHRGKVWVINIGHSGYELLNIPNVFSLRNFEYEE